MTSCRELLARPHLSLLSAQPDRELELIGQIVTDAVRIDGRTDLELWLGRLLAASCDVARVPKTLDLLGHSTASSGLLVLGDWVIDAARPTVTAFFRGLADADVLPQLGVHAVRLLGCRTADTEHGRATILALADILGLEVYGTAHLLYDAHYDAHGFGNAWQFLLTSASDLRRAAGETAFAPPAGPLARMLDIDALPAMPLGPPPAWPRRIASARIARVILELVRRDAGARMAGLLLQPTCEIALPAAQPGAYHVAHVLLGGEFVRFYVDGEGIVYPIDDPPALRRILDTLPGH